jgi:uncharacterized protein (DUF305 family)
MTAQSFCSVALASMLTFVAARALASSSSAGDGASEQPFLSGDERAMDKMMQGMAVHPTGDVDPDFATMMIPHHQGAIEMAVLELRGRLSESQI